MRGFFQRWSVGTVVGNVSDEGGDTIDVCGGEVRGNTLLSPRYQGNVRCEFGAREIGKASYVSGNVGGGAVVARIVIWKGRYVEEALEKVTVACGVGGQSSEVILLKEIEANGGLHLP